MAKRLLRESDTIDRICTLVVENYKFKNNITMTDEEFNEMCKSEDVRKQAILNLNVVDLKTRIFEEYNETIPWVMCHNDAVYIMCNVPEEIIQNIEEWLDGKPLTDIKVHGVSVNDIIRKRFNNSAFIPMDKIFKAMAYWKETDFYDPNFCYRYFV